MATYVIGDIQGCYRTFRKLLRKIEFDVTKDRLWLVGDLVNRGPRSLETLRWVFKHRDVVQTVLGNHDLKLIACDAGVSEPRRRDTLDDLLKAPDRSELVDWLRQQPFLFEEGPVVLVHAGLLPAWSMKKARSYAREARKVLRSADYAEVMREALKLEVVWGEDLRGVARWRGLTDVFTRMRMCTKDGMPSYEYNGPPEDAPKGEKPWFALPTPDRDWHTIVFGHWAALGLHIEPGIIGTDSGCVWGGALTAVRLPDIAVFQERFAE